MGRPHNNKFHHTILCMPESTLMCVCVYYSSTTTYYYTFFILVKLSCSCILEYLYACMYSWSGVFSIIACTLIISSHCRYSGSVWTRMRTTPCRDTRIRNPFSLSSSQISHDLLSMMRLSSTFATRYLMLMVAYHRPVSSPWVKWGV